MLSNCKYIKKRQGECQSKITAIFQEEYEFEGKIPWENLASCLQGRLIKQRVQVNSERSFGDTVYFERDKRVTV